MAEREKELLTLRGTVEDIIYHNDDNDYTVMEVISEDGEMVTAVGKIAYASEGEEVTLYGVWGTHPEYGRQFAFENYERELPTGKTAILRYLSSRTVKGVGPTTAARLVARFGEDTFDVIEHHPEWLVDVPGISARKAAEIHRSFCEQTGIRNLMMMCREFFSTAVISRVYQRFGTDSLEKLQKDPYALCGVIYGYTFDAADRFAAALSFAYDSPERIEGGVRYILEYNALSGGHTCLPEDKLKEAVALRLQVTPEQAEAAVYRALERGKIKRSGEGLALPEMASDEAYIVQKLCDLDASCTLYDTRDVSLLICRIEDEQGIRYAAAQQRAIISALSHGVMLLTGGPGTGKTTIIRALLRIFDFVGLSVNLLAPTGRAANRMSEATVYEAKTIHRALEMERAGEDDRPVFRKDASDPLDAQVLIVDETSMVDVPLLAALLRATKRGTRVVLIGDADQLPSVGAGRVLCDLIESGRFCTVRLEEIFRQSGESLIVTNAHRVNRGEMPILDQKDKDFFFLPCAEDALADFISDLVCRRLPKAYGAGVVNDIQIITPSRKGTAGTERLNGVLQQAANPPDKSRREMKIHGTLFREGDRVMQVRNDYDIPWHKEHSDGAGIFNGEIGVLTELLEEGARVRFDEREAEYDKAALEELDHSYAITIHKSQGSEYPIVVLPLYSCAPMLETRNLLYTAVTRASRMVIAVGNRAVLSRMVANDRQAKRYTALPYLLREATKK